MHETAKHVTVVDPHVVAETMHARHKQAQIEAAVNTWVDVTDEQSLKDFKTVNEALNVPASDYELGINTVIEAETLASHENYESLGMVELARKLGEAERRNDRTTATNISGALLEKIVETANKTSKDEETQAKTQETLFSRMYKIAYGGDEPKKKPEAKVKKYRIDTSLPSGVSEQEQPNKPNQDSRVDASAATNEGVVDTAAEDLAVSANAETDSEAGSPKDEDYDRLFSEATSEILAARQEIQEAKRSGDKAALDAAVARAEQAYAAYDVLMGTETAQSFMSNWLDNAAAQANGESVVNPIATNNAATAEQQSNPAPVSAEDIAAELRAIAAAGGANRSTYFAKLDEYVSAYLSEQKQAGIVFDDEERHILDARLNGLFSLWEQGPDAATANAADVANGDAEPANSNGQETFALNLRAARSLALDAGSRFRMAAANGDLEEAEKAVEMARTAAYDLQRLENWSDGRTEAENKRFHAKYGVWLFDAPANDAANNSNDPNQVIAAASVEANQGADEYQTAFDDLIQNLNTALKNNDRELFEDLNNQALELVNQKAAQERWNEVQTAAEKQRFIDAFDSLQEHPEPPRRSRFAPVRAAFKKVRDFKNRNRQTAPATGIEEVENTSDASVVIATNAPDAQQVTSEQDQPEERKKSKLVYFAIGALGLAGALLLANLDRSEIDDKRSNTAGTSLTVAPGATTSTTAPKHDGGSLTANNTKEKLTANDAIWHHAEANLKKAGIVNPTVAQIDALKDRILLDNGLSEEDAKKLPVGYEFKV